MDFTRQTCSEEGEGCFIFRKGDDLRFPGFKSCELRRLPREGRNDHRVLLCRIIGTIYVTVEKRPAFVEAKKNVLSNKATNCILQSRIRAPCFLS